MAQPVIEVHDLTKQFGKFTAVDHISFTVKKGEIFAFLGPNGAGKSTTIKMLTTLLKPTSGSIELAGHNVLTEHEAPAGNCPGAPAPSAGAVSG
jgi:ABC-2 type transport system ATP-binding protein